MRVAGGMERDVWMAGVLDSDRRHDSEQIDLLLAVRWRIMGAAQRNKNQERKHKADFI